LPRLYVRSLCFLLNIVLLKKISCKDCPNISCLIKKNSVPAWDEFIEQAKYQAIYKKDYSVFVVGSPIAGLFFVQNGMIREFVLRPHNDTEIIHFANDGQVFGHVGFSNIYSSGADAKIDSTICFFNNEVLDKMYGINQKLLYDLMLYYSNVHSESTQRLMNLSQMNLREKVASVLFYLYRNFGLNSSDELLECFNRDDIASLACTTTEQVSRQLSDFQKENIIEKRTRRIAILKPSELQDIIKDYYGLSQIVGV